jgi:hypothetical protein
VRKGVDFQGSRNRSHTALRHATVQAVAWCSYMPAPLGGLEWLRMSTGYNDVHGPAGDPRKLAGTDPDNSLVNDLDLTVQKVRGKIRWALQDRWCGKAMPKDLDDSALRVNRVFVRGRLSSLPRDLIQAACSTSRRTTLNTASTTGILILFHLSLVYHLLGSCRDDACFLAAVCSTLLLRLFKFRYFLTPTRTTSL